jgi:O-antigen/teichoic acid export membrane protein
MARLLDPHILGIVVIVQAVRVGTELLTDVGIEQNVISSKHGDDPTFLNTAWTLQIIRGLIISVFLISIAPLLAGFYSIPVNVFFAVSAAPLISSFTSTSIFTLSREMNTKSRGIFEIICESGGLIFNILLAITMPTMWAPILGLLIGLVIRVLLSYFWPHPRHHLVFDAKFILRIIGFGKWIMLSSLGFYAAMYIDRLYFGKVLTVSMLGVYGLARTIADLPLTLASRLASQILFPLMATNRASEAAASSKEVARFRFKFSLFAAVAIASVMAWSDMAIKALYGDRYLDAGWMLFFLLVNAWAGVLAFLGEAAALGSSLPHVVSVANIFRIAVTAVGLPLGFYSFGIVGAIFALPIGEFARYAILECALWKIAGVRSCRQDLMVTLCFICVLSAWLGFRLLVNLGTPWTALM